MIATFHAFAYTDPLHADGAFFKAQVLPTQVSRLKNNIELKSSNHNNMLL